MSANTSIELALAVEPRRVEVRHGGEVIAETSCALRADTDNGAVYFLPQADVRMDLLRPSPREAARPGAASAALWSLALDVAPLEDAEWLEDVAWSVPREAVRSTLNDRIAFDPNKVDLVAAKPSWLE